MLKGSVSVSKLLRRSSVERSRLGRAGVVSGTTCTGQSLILLCVIVCCIPSRTITVVVLVPIGVQSGHLEGGRAMEEDGSSPATGFTSGQEIEACRIPQCAQKFGFALLITKGRPRCVDLSRGVEGLHIGSQRRIEFRRFFFSEV